MLYRVRLKAKTLAVTLLLRFNQIMAKIKTNLRLDEHGRSVDNFTQQIVLELELNESIAV